MKDVDTNPYTYGDQIRQFSNKEIAEWVVDSFKCEGCPHQYGSVAFDKCDTRQRQRCLDDVVWFLEMEVEEE